MARTPVPIEEVVHARLVEGIVDEPDEVDEDDLDDDEDDDLLDDPDDEEEDDDEDEVDLEEADVHTVPWTPIPTAVARKWIAKHPDAAIDIVFPTVYEEDRSVKLKDLGTAAALGYITHQRAAEQGAKELGFEQYDYDAEMNQIRQEIASMETGTPGAIAPVPSPTPRAAPGTPPKLPEPRAVAVQDPERGVHPGPQPGHKFDGVPRRADISGKAQAAFKKAQRQAEALREASGILRSTMIEAVRHLAEATAPGATADLTAVTEAVARAHFVTKRVFALATGPR